jgi:hypothetical protein
MLLREFLLRLLPAAAGTGFFDSTGNAPRASGSAQNDSFEKIPE